MPKSAEQQITTVDRKDDRRVIAIVGRPNVGKSALFNRLIGRKTAIVHDQPGVTRDRLKGTFSIGDRSFTLWDTGGIGGAGESQLIAHVRKAVESAMSDSDLLLFLVDAQHGLSPIDEELGRWLRRSGKPVMLVINKIDHPKHEDSAADFASLGFGDPISVSAAHGRGMADLLEEIQRNIPDNKSPAIAPASSDGFSNELDIARTRSIDAVEHKPLSIAIVGRPNAGKSSLINAVTKTERAIVSELPGTTRDAVDIFFRHQDDEFLFIDTAGMRKRGKHSTSVEVFSVMRSEKSIRRAELCLLVVDVTSGVTAQDKKIAGLIQQARKPAIVLLNKYDLIRPKQKQRVTIEEVVEESRRRLFFLDYAPVLVTSALSGEHVQKLFRLVKKMERASKQRIGTGALNRLLRAAVAANPPPMVSGRRLKLFYATQTTGPESERKMQPPEFVLFVNEPRLLGETYRRYLEGRIREEQPYPGLPISLTLRPRTDKTTKPDHSRSR